MTSRREFLKGLMVLPAVTLPRVDLLQDAKERLPGAIDICAIDDGERTALYLLDNRGIVWLTYDFWEPIADPEWREICRCPQREVEIVGMNVYRASGDVLIAYEDGILAVYSRFHKMWLRQFMDL